MQPKKCASQWPLYRGNLKRQDQKGANIGLSPYFAVLLKQELVRMVICRHSSPTLIPCVVYCVECAFHALLRPFFLFHLGK